MYAKIIENEIVTYKELPEKYIHDGLITFNPTAEMLGIEEIEIEQREGYTSRLEIVDGAITVQYDEIVIPEPEPVVEPTEEEIQAREQARLQAIAQAKETDFNNKFFETSLGYVKRDVTMANGSHKDFLCDLLPAIILGVNSGKNVNVLTYEKPDSFDGDIELTQNTFAVTSQFISECLEQINTDFGG